MKSKKLLCTLLTVGACLGLFACGGGQTSQPSEGTSPTLTDDLSKSVNLRFNLAYGNRSQTMTYQQSSPITLPDGKTIVSQGSLKPMWRYVSQEINSTFEDRTTQDQKAKDMITTSAATGFTNADIYGGNSVAEQLMSYGVQGKFQNLSEYMDAGLMPNLSRFLEENPDVKTYITAYDGNIYYIPYIAEIGEFARDYHMRESWVEKLLDVDSANYDTSVKIDIHYEGFWKGENARTGDNGGVVKPKDDIQITKKTNQNIISLMNELPTKDGTSLANCLKNYIVANYNYDNPSELYLGAKAAYDIDELVALFRTIKANPSYLTDGKAKEVYPYFTRQGSYREELLRFGTYFNGVKVHGSDSYAARWFIDKDGKLQYSYTQEEFYNVLTYLSQLHAEGLIYEDIYDSTNKSNFRTQLYGSDSAPNGKYGFMIFDFTASTTADGLNSDVVGVLPPVSKVNGVWQYYIDNSRVIKPDGWAISAQSSEEVRIRAATLFDYFFSEEGAKLQNYGLPEMLEENQNFTGPDGKVYPKYNEWTLNTTNEVALGDLSTFLRNWIGALMPIGYSKEIGFEYQYTSERGFAAWKLLKESTTNIPTYAGTGLEGDNPNYYKLVPPVFSLTERQTENIQNTGMTTEGLFEVVFNTVRFKTVGNAPTGVSVPQTYQEYLKVFQDADLDTYVRTYQAAYDTMQLLQKQ